tara:strand:- start:1026 stop:3899 length:2874 start_codon:yes stop_codon:yes gene_type:complete
MATVANYLWFPNSSYTTAKAVACTLKQQDQGVHDQLSFGHVYSGGSSVGYERGIITVRLPQLYDVFGDTTSKFFNSNLPDLTVKDILLKINPDNAVTDKGKYVVYFVKKGYREHQFGVYGASGTGTPHITDYIKDDAFSWRGYSKAQMGYNSYEEAHTSGNLYWDMYGAFIHGDPAATAATGNKDIDQGTDYGHGPNGIIHAFTCENATANIDIPLTSLVENKSLTWGDTFSVMIKHQGSGDGYITGADDATKLNNYNAEYLGDYATSNTLQDCSASTFGGLITSNEVAVALTYEDAVPTKPIIKLSADTDFITPIVKFTTFPSDNDIQTVQLRYHTSNYTSIDTTSDGVSLGNFNLDTYNDLKDTTFLATPNTTYYLTAISSDNTSYIKGNPIVKKRMNCSGSLSAGTAIGTELTLTVTGLVGDYSGKFVKYGVNWNGNGTATNDSLSDYNIITLDEEATTATITHTYDKSIGGNYNINIFTVDRDGFRSNFTQGATRDIVVSNPVAQLSASRDSVVRARYGDDFSVVTLSAAHGYAIGSNRKIMTHQFKHDQTVLTTPVSTNPMENDNSVFNTVSKLIKVKCNKADCNLTEIKIFGRISVDSSGGNDPDNTADFDHYEMKAITLHPFTDADTYGTTAGTYASNEYFKSVDFIIITDLDENDDDSTGTYYTVADSDGNIINNQIRGTPSDYSWGGFVGGDVPSIVFTASNKRITRASGSWITDGYAVGDTVYCNGPDVGANNRLFTINTLTATIMTVNETVTDDAGDAGVQFFKITGPTLTFACADENAPTITHKITDTHTTETADITTTAASSEVTQDVTFESEEHHTLDLDTSSNSGEIAIQSVSLKRNGGLQGNMALGNKRYPVGSTRTRLGLPTLNVELRVLNQTGYRNIWNLIEGDRYNWVTIDSKKIDAPDTAYKQMRLRLLDGTISKDASMASQYTASLNFIMIGELVT